MKLCIVTTMWSSINNWIKPFLNAYHEAGVDVTIVCNMDSDYEAELHRTYPWIHTRAIDFPRGMSAFGSLRSIFRLRKVLRSGRFDMVQYSTPNASLYGAVAGWMAQVPVRLYCQWGMVYVTRKGLARKVLRAVEATVCRLSTRVQPDSRGNLDFCRAEGLYSEAKSEVIWNGSAKGLDLSAYDIASREQWRSDMRRQLEIADDAPVLGFVGRLGREKGCNELFTAYRELKKRYPELRLLFVGPIEKEETIEPELLEFFRSDPGIIITGRVSGVERYMAAMDVFALPSYREGFGMSVVEASAMGLPVVTTAYPGPSSAMEEGVTGYTVPVGDSRALADTIARFLDDPALGRRMGEQGRRWAEANFEFGEFSRRYIANRLDLLRSARKK